MKTFLQLSFIFAIAMMSCNSNEKETKKANYVKTNLQTGSEELFTDLTSNVLDDFQNRNIEETNIIVKKLEALIPNFKEHWNYGNAIHKVNIAKGRIAIQEGKIEDAKKYLLEAGKTPGSPQLNSFGPNMSLAKELLHAGEKEGVLDYLELCKNFWEMDRGRLDEWKKRILKGIIPDFKTNLRY